MKNKILIWVNVLLTITIITISMIIIQGYNKLEKKYNLLLIKSKQSEINISNKLKKVNVVIHNITDGSLGSGVIIKYKNNYYILTCYHLLNYLQAEDKNQSTLILFENGADKGVIEVLGYNAEYDLLLCKLPDKYIPQDYVELATFEPDDYEKIYIMGNPYGLEDFYSEGIVYTTFGYYTIFKDNTYFGNSGGGIYNKNGELVGIVSKLSNANIYGINFTLYYAIRLTLIKFFLKSLELP